MQVSKKVRCEKLRFLLFSLELNMLCRGTGFRTQFRLKMGRKKLCNISFFVTQSPSIYKLATRDFSLINRGTEWTGSGRTGWFWSRWPTPCIILTTPGSHDTRFSHIIVPLMCYATLRYSHHKNNFINLSCSLLPDQIRFPI